MTAKALTAIRPLIGLTTGTDAGVAGADPVKCSANMAYIRAIEHSGGVPILLPCMQSPALYAQLLDLIDGLLITGGPDLAPSFFGEQPHERLGRVDGLRDSLEAAVIPEALARDMPILGICRGVQSLNVFAGGTLYQDLSEMPFEALDHAQSAHRTVQTHEVVIAKGSRLRRILRRARIAVNSTHHQGLKDIAEGFVVTARSPDVLVEAIERKGGRFCIGVQWHPEELFESDAPSRRLFKAFVSAARQGRKDGS